MRYAPAGFSAPPPALSTNCICTGAGVIAAGGGSTIDGAVTGAGRGAFRFGANPAATDGAGFFVTGAFFGADFFAAGIFLAADFFLAAVFFLAAGFFLAAAFFLAADFFFAGALRATAFLAADDFGFFILDFLDFFAFFLAICGHLQLCFRTNALEISPENNICH
jgi:hypothetical protein